MKREIFFPNFINLAVAPFDNAAKLFLNFHDNFTFVECSPFEHSKKIFLILYLLLLNDIFSTRKPLFRIENIFYLNSFVRNTFFLSANLFLNCIKIALPTIGQAENIIFLYHASSVDTHSLCVTGFIFYKILNFLLHTHLVDHKNL